MSSLAWRQKLGKNLYYQKRPTKWDKGIGAYLPEAYKKFFVEWRIRKPKALHFVEEKGRYRRDEKTGIVYPVQNVPIPLKFPKEQEDGLWGGEGVIQGFTKKDRYHRRVPKFFFPDLKMSVVYSQVLDKYISVTLTNRALNLIHENYGLDHYILKTPACDLRSKLGVRIKRKILTALLNKTLYPDDPAKREEVYNTYKEYLSSYTPEEIEWYGLTFEEAVHKWKRDNYSKTLKQPLKIELRRKLIESLEDAKENERKPEDAVDRLLEKMSNFSLFKKKPPVD